MMYIFVWNKNQIGPATLYGRAKYPGNFVVRVSDDPRMDATRHGDHGLVYHFTSGGGSGSK